MRNAIGVSSTYRRSCTAKKMVLLDFKMVMPQFVVAILDFKWKSICSEFNFGRLRFIIYYWPKRRGRIQFPTFRNVYIWSVMGWFVCNASNIWVRRFPYEGKSLERHRPIQYVVCGVSAACNARSHPRSRGGEMRHSSHQPPSSKIPKSPRSSYLAICNI